jgi:hypothetical protein
VRRALARRISAGLVVLFGVSQARAAGDTGTEPSNPDFSASFEVWTYASHTFLDNSSVLNPGNVVLHLPDDQIFIDPRLNLHARWNASWGQTDVEVDPRWQVTGSHTDCPQGCAALAYSGPVSWNQAFARVRAGDTTLVAGRELLTWGPATFRSPSNPFYFNGDRTNPLANTPGIDLVRATHAWSGVNLTGAYVFSTRALYPSISTTEGDATALLKLDKEGENYLVSVVGSHRKGGALFVAGFAQVTPHDAWLLYGEWNSSSPGTRSLPGPGSSNAPLGKSDSARRAWTALLGASYTFGTGQVASAEYLYNGHGYGREQEARFFGQAATHARLLSNGPGLTYGNPGEVPAQSSALLGQHYLWLGLQSNPQQTKQYWRFESAQNLQDLSCQVLAYYERSLSRYLSTFVSITINAGGPRSEFGALFSAQLTVGLKAFVF